jgi:uncharacterized membrane protein YgcG
MGGSRSTIRMVRLGVLVLFLVLTAAFRGHGSTDHTLHDVYLVIFVGLIVATIAMSRRGGGRGMRGGRFGPGGNRFGGGSFGSGPPQAQQFPAENPDPES